MSALPMISTRLPLVRRGPGTVQVGLEADHGVVIEGLDAAEIDFLAQLDGLRSLPSLRRSARRAGLDSERVQTLLDTLSARNLLMERHVGADAAKPWWLRARRAAETLAVMGRVGSPTPSRPPGVSDSQAARGAVLARERCRVLVDGHGTVAEAIAQVLREGGIGHVASGAQSGARADFEDRSGSRRRSWHAVVVVRRGVMPPDLVDGWSTRGVCTIPVVASEHAVVVGPVLAGRSERSAPCARCLDNYRASIDPQWQLVLAQLAQQRQSGRPVDLDAASGALVAGLVGLLTTAALDARHRSPASELTSGLAFQVRPNAYDVRRFQWPVHPECLTHEDY